MRRGPRRSAPCRLRPDHGRAPRGTRRALLYEARRRGGFVVVSIFVNALQFGQNEDYARYPRDLAADLRTLEPAGVDLVLAPAPAAMYETGDETRVRVTRIAEPLEGARRPGPHFEG